MFNITPSSLPLTEKQKYAIHLFDAAGHSLMTKMHLEQENARLLAENERLKALLVRERRRREQD